MFTGRRYDEETSLYYYRARYYSPDIGRFLQTDPIGYIAGLNLYAYCGNDPLNWIDPWGLDPKGSVERDYEMIGYRVVPWGWDLEALDNWEAYRKWSWTLDVLTTNPDWWLDNLVVDSLIEQMKKVGGAFGGWTPYLRIQECEWKQRRYWLFWKKSGWLKVGEPYYYKLVGYPGSIWGDMYTAEAALKALYYGEIDFYTKWYYGYTIYKQNGK